MKKLIVFSVLATALALTSQNTASAWSNIKFGAGVNLHWQTGDNNLLWGFFRNGQIPHPGGFQAYPMHGHGYAAPYVVPGGDSGSSGGEKNTAVPTTPTNQVGYQGYNPYGYQNQPYYPASYQQGNPYQLPAYYPSHYSQQVPAYWYGR